MKEYFISEIDIEKLYHLSDIKIKLDATKRQHLLLTGKNGSGKTSLLLRIESFLKTVNNGELILRKDGVKITLNEYEGLEKAYQDGNFITAYFPAERKAQFIQPYGVENVILPEAYKIDHNAGNILLKYMVHLKTQQAYAQNEGAEAVAEKIQQEGREPFGFNELSDGYSSVIYMVSDLILRMDKNWLLGEEISHYDYQGIVLIDELETHLHIELQKKIFPFLTEFFPGIQFIVTTHSPYILNSVSNAKAYDLERKVELDHLAV